MGSSLITIGTSTAAWAGTRSVSRGSRRNSGTQAGGVVKRARKARASKREGATAGNPTSIPTTGTWRGSKDRSADGRTALTDSTEAARMVDGGGVVKKGLAE